MSWKRDSGKHKDFMEWVVGLVHALVPGGQGRSDDSEAERRQLVEETAAHVMQLIFEGSGDEGLAKRKETGALRRLQRESFSDLLKMRERLDKLELHTGLRQLKNFGSSAGLSKTQMRGHVNAGGALVLMKDSSSRQSRNALEHAGMLTGLEVKFRFETSFRDNDKLVTECIAGQGSEAGSDATFGGPISIRKVAYTAEISDRISVAVAPLGGDSSDMLQAVNPLQDVGLTSFSSNGPILYNHCKGSGVGATVKGTRSVCSFSQYIGGWENCVSGFGAADSEAPLCLSTVAQLTAVPADFMAVSLTALNRYWPSPPLPSHHSLHWSEMGPLVLSKIQSSASSLSLGTSNGSVANGQLVNWSTSDLDTGALDSKGAAMQSFALAAEVDLGPVNLGGWAQVDRGDWLLDSDKKQVQWALTMAKSAGDHVVGGLTIGQSKPDLWSSPKGDEGSFSSQTDNSQMQVEAFLRLTCGNGFVLQPGLLYTANKQSRTPAAMLRSAWTL